jgi:hypothetical protein
MVANRMTGIDHGASNVWPLVYKPAYQEKRRLNVMTIQNIKQLPGVRIIGPVVIGKSQNAHTRRQAGERLAVNLRGRPHGLKSRPSGQASDAGGA